MIDNFEQIKNLLEFPNDDIYYHLQILRRGKDHPELSAANRVIKAYYVCSLEGLDYIEEEIKGLCEYFGARAYINLAPKSIKKTTALQLKYLAQRMYEGDYKKIWKSWNTCAGEIKGEEPRWIVDVDNLIPREDILKITDINERGNKFAYNHNIVTSIEFFINNNCDPLERDYGGYLIYKTLYCIETKSGVHIITKPFNLRQFKEKYPDIDVHKNNPTLLYCL